MPRWNRLVLSLARERGSSGMSSSIVRRLAVFVPGKSCYFGHFCVWGGEDKIDRERTRIWRNRWRQERKEWRKGRKQEKLRQQRKTKENRMAIKSPKKHLRSKTIGVWPKVVFTLEKRDPLLLIGELRPKNIWPWEEVFCIVILCNIWPWGKYLEF